MKTHVELLAWIHIVGSGLGLVVALFVFFLLTLLAPLTGDAAASRVLLLVGIVVSGFVVALSVPGVIVGLGLLKHKSWARKLGLVLALFNLFNFPIGTLVAVYTFWTLTQEETTTLLAESAHAPTGRSTGQNTVAA